MDPELKSGYFFFCKSPGWSYEEEVRLILPRNLGSKVKLEPRWLTRVILGYKMSDSNRKLVREWAKQRNPQLVVIDGRFDTLHQRVTLASPLTTSSGSK